MKSKKNPPLTVCILKEWKAGSPPVTPKQSVSGVTLVGTNSALTQPLATTAGGTAKTGIIVIDPGHGGKNEVGGSSANNATSASGVLEKNITLRIAFLVREQLQLIAASQGHNITVILTRESDVNLSLSARANVAKTHKADLFLCIHCNAFNGKARGTETLISPISNGNTNHAADLVFAQTIQTAVFNAILDHDQNAKDRKVKDQVLGVLRDSSLGNNSRGCLIELEFIDVPEVDVLLNIGPQSSQVRLDIAKALAEALITAL